jgi:hypothetical protein
MWTGGGPRWIEYRYPEPRVFGWTEVHWAELPASWRVEWWDGTAWRPAEGASSYPVVKDRFNRATFSPVRTNRIRLSVAVEGRRQPGILEWRVGQ